MVVDERNPDPIGPVLWNIVGSITLDELQLTIKAMNAGAPAPDGMALVRGKKIQGTMHGRHPRSAKSTTKEVLATWRQLGLLDELATRALKYTKMLGNGDSSTYGTIVEREPYGEDCIPEKLECIGHVQKRVGSRLRKLKSSHKGLKLDDGKGLSGKGRLTDAKIDILQNYYGLAVRENLDSVDNMAKHIEASLYHVASTAENPQHHLCPAGEDSWCGYNRDKKGYKHKNGIPSSIVELIKPIYKDLSNPVLLSKCTHGLTQNVNECLNGLIWERYPKTIYVEQETVALATYLAILKFNDGDISLLRLFSDLDIIPGVFTAKGADDSDDSRIKLSAKKSTQKVKRRKVLRHQRKHYVDSLEDKKVLPMKQAHSRQHIIN